MLFGIFGCTPVDSGRPDAVEKGALADRALEDIQACIEEHLPGSAYMTKDFLSSCDGIERAGDQEALESVRVGMPWIFNDEEAPWYIAVEKGYFREEGLEVELVPGGPGRDSQRMLVGGSIDIAVVTSSAHTQRLVASRTPGDVVAVGAILKHNPYAWLALDTSIPREEKSQRIPKPEDLVGKTVGVQAGAEFHVDFIIGRCGLPPDSVRAMKVGFSPDVLILGAVDFYGGWIVNQPRLLEEKGYYNWMSFPFPQYGMDEYADVSVVRREMLTSRPGVIQSYLTALVRALRYMIENPVAAADIAVRYAHDAKLTRQQVLRRFELQLPFILGEEGSPLMQMESERLDEVMAVLLKYGQVEIPGCM